MTVLSTAGHLGDFDVIRAKILKCMLLTYKCTFLYILKIQAVSQYTRTECNDRFCANGNETWGSKQAVA